MRDKSGQIWYFWDQRINTLNPVRGLGRVFFFLRYLAQESSFVKGRRFISEILLSRDTLMGTMILPTYSFNHYTLLSVCLFLYWPTLVFAQILDTTFYTQTKTRVYVVARAGRSILQMDLVEIIMGVPFWLYPMRQSRSLGVSFATVKF